MTVQRVPLDSVQKIRQYIQSTLVLPESENTPRTWSSFDDVDSLPEPDSLSDLGDLFNFGSPIEEATHAPNTQGQWFISSIDPGAALLKLPGLKLKTEWRLVSYLRRVQDSGVGVVWAVPERLSTTAQLELVLTAKGASAESPRPEGALENFMDVVEGDRSPASFVVASILQRELREFGKTGKSCDWLHQRLIGALPTQVSWQWQVEIPKDLSPKVRLFPDGKAAVEFFTCQVVAPITLFQHIDQYPGDRYRADSIDRSIAIAQKPVAKVER